MLHRRDITGAICVVRRLSNQVGIGSKQHDLHLFSSLAISSTVTGSKQLNGGTNLVLMHGGAAVAVEVRIVYLASTECGKVVSWKCWSVGLDGGCSNVFTARQRACGLWLWTFYCSVHSSCLLGVFMSIYSRYLIVQFNVDICIWSPGWTVLGVIDLLLWSELANVNMKDWVKFAVPN